jgi:hypothetical protein
MGSWALDLCVGVVLDDGHGLALERRVEALFNLAVEAVLVGGSGRERERERERESKRDEYVGRGRGRGMGMGDGA